VCSAVRCLRSLEHPGRGLAFASVVASVVPPSTARDRAPMVIMQEAEMEQENGVRMFDVLCAKGRRTLRYRESRWQAKNACRSPSSRRQNLGRARVGGCRNLGQGAGCIHLEEEAHVAVALHRKVDERNRAVELGAASLAGKEFSAKHDVDDRKVAPQR